MATNLIRADSPSNAKQKPVRHGAKAQPCAELSEKDVFQKKTSNLYNKNQNYANPPAGGHHANPATPTDFVTASFSEAAAQANRSWADLTEDNKHESEDPFITVQRKKRRRGSAESPAAAAPSSGTRGAGATRRPRSSTGWAPRAEEVRTTQAHIAEARARQASSTEDHCVYVERSPELEPYHYIRAIDRMFGSTREVFKVTKMNGHFLVGLANKSMAERLVNEGLEVEGTLHRAFPFRKRAERITVGNLPFFVGDAAVISALSSFGRVTSIAPKLMKAGPYVYNDGRREAFIIFREGMTIERLPTRLDITIKGEAWPAYLSTGIRCSRCRGQGHRRANCPLLAGRTTEPGPATPSSTTSVPPATAPKLPQQPSAQPPPLASHSPAMEVSDVPPASRAALLPPAALRPSPPAPLASPAEAAPPAPPPVTPAPSLRTPGSREPAAPTPDIEMSNVEESPPPLSPPEPAAVPPTPPLPAPQPAGPIPPAPDEEEMTPIMREECMVIEIFKKLKHLTCLRPLYQSGIQPDDLKDAILFIDERESLMARLTPAMRGVLAEFLSAAIEPARGNHPDVSSDLATFPLCLDHDCLYFGRTVKGPTRCSEVLENSPPLTVPRGYYRFDPRLPQLIARVDEDYHNEGDHNEEGKDCPDRKEPRSKMEEQARHSNKTTKQSYPQRHSRTSRKISRCSEVLENSPLLTVPRGYYRFDPRLPQLIARVDEVHLIHHVDQEALENSPPLTVPRGYYRFDPRLPQLIARVDELAVVFLTNEQKLCRLATCEDMLEMRRTDPEWKDKIITGYETWNASAFVIKTGSTTQWQVDLAPKEMAASDMRNRRHVQLLLTWSTNAAHPVSLD
ncbi:hypothetical protein LAZ67_X004450 [Cordylochernes scorpioides]|uniref:CCHC-type domain-containing protein n=1 Tax=Cordylochernes scorpioides TaxID=51811 RepID=A0ABY6LY99_9ARAC|nr:hypothetical protein LAZ67_X004450 [Cordylochernes scorpioides]